MSSDSIWRKAANGDEDASAYLRMAGNAGVKHSQVPLHDWRTLPFGFDEINLVGKLNAPIDLFADDTERRPGIELVCGEQVIQKLFQGVAPLLWRQRADCKKLTS